MNKVVIPLANGYRLVAEQNEDSEFNQEMFIGIETDKGSYFQDLAVIRPTYKFKDESVVFSSDKFEVLVFADSQQDDYTNKFTISLYKDESDE